MNPDTNRLEQLTEATGGIYRADGTPVPKHWATFQIGELVVIKNYTFRVAYLGETAILFEPVKPTEPLNVDEIREKMRELTGR